MRAGGLPNLIEASIPVIEVLDQEGKEFNRGEPRRKEPTKW